MAASSSQPETMKAECSLYNPKACYSETSDPVLHVTLLGGEWGSSAGGLSTINRELAIHLSQQSAVKVSLLVPEGACNNEEKNEAHTYGITIVETKRRAAFDRLDWLNFPPHEHLMDIVVGHGVKLGRQIQVIRDSARFPNCKWVQVVHTAPEDLSRYKCYSDPISKGETKHESEVELCKLADLVVPVGPRLKEAYSSYLQRCKTADRDVLTITPGLFQREFGDLVAKQDPNEDGVFKVLLFGRGDDEDFELKGYNIAAQAFTDQRLKNKPYHLIFVGAPEGKQEEVRQKLLQHGMAEAQLTVRKFIQSRDRLKDLLCEADLVIMPSKSEGFGLVALEALSAGLPILVGSNSGIAKALENVPNGYSCIVCFDDPAKWAEAIEAVRVRHRMRLEEIKALKASYGELYSWKEQCEELVQRMWKKVNGSSENGNKRRIKAALVAESFLGKSAEKKAPFAAGGQTEIFQSQSGRKRKISGPSSYPDIVTRHCYQDLSDEQEKIIHEILTRQIQAYTKYRRVSTQDGVSALCEHIQDAYNLALRSVGVGSLEIKFQCTSLESIESLWSDYQSGHLNDIAERYLVTDDIKKKLNLKNVRLETTIEEENYRICKEILTEKSSESNQETASLPIDKSPDKCEEGKRFLTHMERAEMAKTSRGPLHKAATSGQYETVKMLLQSGEDVDQRDQFFLTPLHLACWYGQESVVKLLLKHGANVNAEDRFQRTPLQKAERQNHHCIVLLLRKNDARPSLHQPVSLKNLSRKAFLQVDERSGFNLLQAAVFEEKYNIVLEASGFFYNFVVEMELTKTGKNAKEFVGKTAVDFLSLRKRTNPFHVDIERIYEKLADDNSRLTKLECDTCNDDAELAVELVLNDGSDVNVSGSDNDYTALLQASRSSSSEFIETLIDLGADVNAQMRKSKETPLILAADWNNYMAASLIVRHGADVNVHISNGFTPLHVSVNKGHENLMRLLLKHNAKVDIQDTNGYTPLHQSFLKGNERLCRLLLEHNADVNIQDNHGYTPLHWCALKGNENPCRLLLEHNADVNVHDNDGYTPLHLSAREGNENICRLLLEHNADVNTQDDCGYTPLHWSASIGNEKLCRLLLEHNADVNTQDDGGYTPLHWCASIGKNENLCGLLLEHNADVNAQDKGGSTPLHWCASIGNEKLCRLLLEHNADVNTQDDRGYTPLHWCASIGNENLCRLLLEHNGDENTQDGDGYTLLHLCTLAGNENLCRLLLERNADINIQDNFRHTPLHWCVRDSNESLCRLLLEHNADVDIQDYLGYTPLHWCALKDNKDLCRLLLEHNADVNIQDYFGYTPLNMCAKEGNENLCRLLLEHNADVNTLDEDGYTPLHWCALRGSENLCRLLLERNADVNTQDDGGYTPLHWCALKGNEDLCRLLLEHNADVNIQNDRGYTPLNMCAKEGNENLCRLLLEHNADVNTVDEDGYTPLHWCVLRGNENHYAL